MPRGKRRIPQVAPGIKLAQLIALNMIDGNTGIAGLGVDGYVYTYTGTGWVRLSMLEVKNDFPV